MYKNHFGNKSCTQYEVEYRYALQYTPIDGVFLPSVHTTACMQRMPLVCMTTNAWNMILTANERTGHNTCISMFLTCLSRIVNVCEQIRQYFRNASFYEDDVTRRGLCADLPNANDTNSFICEAFSPAAATLKVSFRST